MATPLGTTFSTDEQVVAQGNITYMRKMVESLFVEFDQAKYEEFLSSGSRALGRGSTERSPQGPLSSPFRGFFRRNWRDEYHG